MSRVRRKQWSTQFVGLPRNKQSEQAIRVRNRCTELTPRFGGLFYTDESIGGAPSVDITFPSRRYKNLFYCGTIANLVSAYRRTVMFECRKLAYSELTPEETKAQQRHMSSEASLTKSILDRPKAPCLDKLDGQTAYDFAGGLRKLLREVISVRAGVELDYTGRRGIGIDIYVEEQYLSIEVINRAILEFYDRGEVEWKSERAFTKREIEKALSIQI